MTRFAAHAGPLALLTALATLYFMPLVLSPTQTIYSPHSDFLSVHLPSKQFLMHRLRTDGELPLWNPCTFSGQTFIGDTQVSAFYPPQAILYLLPESALGAGMSWLAYFHVLLAGWGAYGYAASRRMPPWYAFVAGLGFMFGGKCLIHSFEAGHYYVLPVAWLPILVGTLERAIARRSLFLGTLAGVVFGIVVLGAYPYIMLYMGLFTAAWCLGLVFVDAAPEGTPRSRLSQMAVCGAYGVYCVILGSALAAVQLLPGLEAGSYATRSLGIPATNQFRGGLESMVTLTGRAVVTPNFEFEGGLGVLWLALAVLGGVWLCGRPRFYGIMALSVLFYVVALAPLLQGLPGFRYFRIPSRALVLAPFPISLLVAECLLALCGPRRQPIREIAQPRVVLLKVLFALSILQGMYAMIRVAQGQVCVIKAYWLILPITTACAWWLLGLTQSKEVAGGSGPDRGPFVFRALVLLLAVDLISLTGFLIHTVPWDSLTRPSALVAELLRHTEGQFGRARVISRNPQESFSTRTPLWPNQQDMLGLETVGGYNPTDVLRYRQYLQMTSGSDAPLVPTQGAFSYPVLESFPVRNKRLLDLLGVRFLIQPRWNDAQAKKPYLLPGEDDVASDPRWRVLQADEKPRTFDVLGGGLIDLPLYVLYENTEVLPRVWVVGQARPLPTGDQRMPALATGDFRQMVFLEEIAEPVTRGTLAVGREVQRIDSRPNRVEVRVDSGEPGYLVLADIWTPGWECTVNDVAVPVKRGNFLFRAVEIPAEKCDVTFRFEPKSYTRGKVVSLVALVFAALMLAVSYRRRDLVSPVL